VVLKAQLYDRLLHKQSLARFTAARLGGAAEWLYIARDSYHELAEMVLAAWDDGLPVRILGGGANVLVSDDGVRGLVIINRLSEIIFGAFAGDSNVIAASGTSLSTLTRRCQSQGLAGMEWAVSVPGTVGGAVVNNAGAHGGDMAGVVRRIALLDAQHGFRVLPVESLDYAYRHSSLKARDDRRYLVLLAALSLPPGAPDDIQTTMDTFIAQRKRTQPPGASLGSIFKNPPGDYAGRLIESVGLKGYTIGGAQVSPLHANFFINVGDATAHDYYALIQHAQRTVREQTGVELELEVELVGEW